MPSCSHVSAIMKENSSGVYCDRACRRTLDLLFSQYKDHCSNVISNLDDDEDPGTENPALENEVYLFLEARLSIFLSSIAMSRSRVYQASEGVVVNESERRAAVDSLMQFFWCSQDEQLSDTYL